MLHLRLTIETGSSLGEIPHATINRMGRQRASGCNWHALVAADTARWKRVMDDGLRSHTDRRQATEEAIATKVLKRMLDPGRPECIRIA